MTARTQALRARRKAAGMIRFEAWVPASRKAEILAMIEGALAAPAEEPKT